MESMNSAKIKEDELMRNTAHKIRASRKKKSSDMHKPPMDQKTLSPMGTKRSRSRSLEQSPAKYLGDIDEHPHLSSTPRVQAIDLSALQKKK